MKITFILAAIGKKENQKYIKTWKKMEPLTIATLKAITPEDIETEFYDDRLELIDYDTKTDLVAITFETYTTQRAYQIARNFRERDIPVVMGGYHSTLMPEEVAEHADSVFIGNAENTWIECIEDFKNGQLKKYYQGDSSYSNKLPDRSIFKGKKYTPLGLIETGRGCCFNCEFCSITKSYKARYYPRNIDLILRDIENTNKMFYFFVDDNIVADQSYAIEFFKRLTPLKVRWSGQGSINLAKNKELLYWMKKSGCEVLLIGFESLDKQNLKQMNKQWTDVKEIDNMVKKIHDEGISLYATFLFGFDYDTEETFEKTLEFALRQDFFFVAFNHLLPFPGTRLYDRLLKEDRLIDPKWWLNVDYKYGDIPYTPKNLTPEQLSDLCVYAREEFYKNSSIFRRSFKLLQRNFDPLMYYLFLTQNFNLKKEVNGKMTLPLGKNLDELPK